MILSTKVCSACKEDLPREHFYRDRRTSSGLQGYCKECQRGKNRESRPKYRERQRIYARTHRTIENARNARQRANHPERIRARKRVQKAVDFGRLVRPDVCERCGKTGEIHAHHEDYAKPLDVIWLCLSCHSKTWRRP